MFLMFLIQNSDLRPVSFELKTLKTLIPQEAFVFNVFNVFNSKATKSQIWDSGASVFLMCLMFLIDLKTLIPRKACVLNVFNWFKNIKNIKNTEAPESQTWDLWVLN